MGNCKQCGKETEALAFYGLCWKCYNKKELEKDKERAIEEEGLSSDRAIHCPFCGEDHGIDEMHESREVECFECGKKFYVEIEYSANYTTSKLLEEE